MMVRDCMPFFIESNYLFSADATPAVGRKIITRIENTSMSVMSIMILKILSTGITYEVIISHEVIIRFIQMNTVQVVPPTTVTPYPCGVQIPILCFRYIAIQSITRFVRFYYYSGCNNNISFTFSTTTVC